MRQKARAGEDVIDFSMGNPDQPTPDHIVKKLVETANREDTHRYSQRELVTSRNGELVDVMTWTSMLRLRSSRPSDRKRVLRILPWQLWALVLSQPSLPIHPYGFVIAGADIRHVPLLPGEDFFELPKRSNLLA